MALPLTGAEVQTPQPPVIRFTQPSINRLVRWGFLLFVFSIPFEYPDRPIPVEITTLTGAVFLLTTLLQPRLCYGRRPAALWWFVAYLAAVVVSFVLNGERYSVAVFASLLQGPPGQVITRTQLILIFWTGFNLMRVPKVGRDALFTLIAACALLAGLQLVFSGVLTAPTSAMRKVSILGQNANRTSQILAAGLLATIGLAYGGTRKLIRPRWLAWPVAGMLALAIVQGGSRAGILALGAGLLAMAASAPTLATQVRNAVVVILAVAGFTWLAVRSPTVSARFERAAAGDYAGREEIYPVAWRMYLDRPVIGWGPVANKYELASRLFRRDRYMQRDTHNIVLEVLTATGLLGGIPFLMGTALCIWAAWRARRGRYGMLPLALVVSILAGNMTHNYIAFKLHWVILAFALASAADLERYQRVAGVLARRLSPNRSRTRTPSW
jgi:O-antigen ligase